MNTRTDGQGSLEGMAQEMKPKDNVYRVTGKVVHGKGNGKTVGMPTANLKAAEGTVLPPLGVYASLVYIKDEIFCGVTNVGTRPSVDSSEDITIETMILDFHREIYGQEITVELHLYLRPISHMASLKAVELQVEKDSLRVRDYFAQFSHSGQSHFSGQLSAH